MTTITVATMNDDWASKGTNIADVTDVDVVLIQEGRVADYAALVDKRTHKVAQDLTTPGTAGSVIVWFLADVVSQKTGLTFGVKANGLLARYLAWMRALVGGRKVLFISAHRPPKRARKWWKPFDVALAARVRRAQLAGRLVIVGIDSNEHNHTALAALTGLVWHSIDDTCIDGFLMSKQVKVQSLRALPKDTSDHQPLVAVVQIPAAHKKPKPPKPTPTPAPEPQKPPVVSYPAITAARHQSHDGPQASSGMCLQMVRTCYGIPARDPSASAAWAAAKHKHPETDPHKIPRGYPVFWTGGSHGFGHIAVSAGNGMCWSTDIKRSGFFDYVPIDQIRTQWGLTLVGWTEDINGVTATITK